MKNKNHNKSIILRTLILGVCIYMIATLGGLINTLNESRAELDALNKEYTTEKNEIEQLKALLSEDTQAHIIEKAARERLGYVFPEEQVFIDISGS